MITHNMAQGSQEWFAVRLGKFTASHFADLMSGKTTKGYEKAIYRVVYERLTGEMPDDFKSGYMDRGNELEAAGLELYSDLKFYNVQRVGFVERDEWTGCSPDGLIGTDGMIQVKAPAYNTMINYLVKREIPTEYRWQMQGEMMITGRKWSDFMAYHPKLRPVITRLFASPADHAILEKEIQVGIQIAKNMLIKLKI